MSLSKPFQNALISYFSNLYINQVRTKAITSCILISAGNLLSQYLSGSKTIDRNSLLAYALFGLLFGGTVPHYYYKLLEHLVPREASFPYIKKLLIDRLMYAPLYQAFSLYTIARLEGKSHDDSMRSLKALYFPLLKSNWTYLTAIQLVNITLVPPMMRVLVMNIVSFMVVVYVAKKRREQEAKAKK